MKEAGREVEYKYSVRLQPPKTYGYVRRASAELSSHARVADKDFPNLVASALRETTSMNFAQITLANYLPAHERILLADAVYALAIPDLENNPFDRVARSALRFSNRLRSNAVYEIHIAHA